MRRRLAALGRIHSPDETRRAAEELHAAGLANFNLDLMYALPGQDVAGALRDVEEALALAPAHLSHYQLTLEPGTVFAAQPAAAAGRGRGRRHARRVRRAARGRGLRAVRGLGLRAAAAAQCRHNLNYWTFGDYLGVGAGAHGKLTCASRAIVRTTQLREPRRYLAAQRRRRRAPVPERELPFEFMLNALRLGDGFEAAPFGERTGLDWESIARAAGRRSSAGLLVAPAAAAGRAPWACGS